MFRIILQRQDHEEKYPIDVTKAGKRRSLFLFRLKGNLFMKTSYF